MRLILKNRYQSQIIEAYSILTPISRLRVRPKALTIAVTLAGLLPIMYGGGAEEIMTDLAARQLGL